MRTLIALTLFAAACSSSSSGDDGDDTTYDCVAEKRDDDYAMGITKVGQNGKLNFKIVDAMPAPPGRGDNTWTIELTTTTAAPVQGAAMIVTPKMPDHTHNNSIPVTIEAMPQAGQYKLTPIVMWMVGLWNVTIDVQGQDADKAVFSFCVPS